MPRGAAAVVAAICCWSIFGCGGPSKSELQRFASRKRGDSPAPANPPKAETGTAKAVSKAVDVPPPATKNLPPAPAQPNSATERPSAQISTDQSRSLPTGSGEIRIVVQNEKPKETLSVAERRTRSLANLEK